MYEFLVYIVENVNGDVIVIDWNKNVIIVVNRLGIYWYLFLWKEGKLFICLVVIDLVGYVFIIDFFGIKICILDRDGWFLRYIVFEDDINNVCGLCIFGNGEVIVVECIIGIVKRIKYLEY